MKFNGEYQKRGKVIKRLATSQFLTPRTDAGRARLEELGAHTSESLQFGADPADQLKDLTVLFDL